MISTTDRSYTYINKKYSGFQPVFFPGYIFILISTITSGRVLFAANVEDFRSLAKQFVPDHLADKLVAIVSEASGKYQDNNVFIPSTPDNDKVDDYYDDDERADEKDEELHDKKQDYDYEYALETSTATNFRQAEDIPDTYSKPQGINEKKAVQVNLDQLVEKVKERLLFDFTKDPTAIKKLITGTTKSRQMDKTKMKDKKAFVHKDNTISTTTERYDEKLQFKRKPNENIDNDDVEDAVDEADNVPVDPSADNPNSLFKEVDLNTKARQKDSYEDYVMPKKDDIFISEEGTTAASYKAKIVKITTKPDKLIRKPLKQLKSITTEDYEDSKETGEPDSFKARTENIGEDYNQATTRDRNPNRSFNIKPDSINKTPKKTKLGTMIPIRETYKMVSPNYYRQLPTVAVKYNFDEPIPVKDQEYENLKPIGNPPANINGKVKLRTV